MNVQFFHHFAAFGFKILISLVKGQVQEHHAVSHQGEINDMQWKILSKFSVYRIGFRLIYKYMYSGALDIR